MHARLAEIVEYLDGSRTALLDAVNEVPPDRRDVRPAEGVWSVAEVLDHLYMTEAGSAKLLARRLLRAKESGLAAERETSSLLSCLDSHQIDRPVRKLVAPEIVRPRPDVRAEAALADLIAVREALLDTMREADGYDLTLVTATHPVLGEINMYQWAVFLGKHEARHVAQIQATRDALLATGDGQAAIVP